jgi:hypothetical protein
MLLQVNRNVCVTIISRNPPPPSALGSFIRQLLLKPKYVKFLLVLCNVKYEIGLQTR